MSDNKFSNEERRLRVFLRGIGGRDGECPFLSRKTVSEANVTFKDREEGIYSGTGIALEIMGALEITGGS